MNAREVRAEIIENVADALNEAFDWGSTPQGVGYWAEVHDNLLSMAKSLRTGRTRK